MLRGLNAIELLELDDSLGAIRTARKQSFFCRANGGFTYLCRKNSRWKN